MQITKYAFANIIFPVLAGWLVINLAVFENNVVAFLITVIATALLGDFALFAHPKISNWKKIVGVNSLEISPEPIDFLGKRLDLLITNNEWRKDFVKIEKVQIWHDENVIATSPANISEIKKKGSKTISFIVLSKKGDNFSIRHSEKTFGEGTHKFNVSVIFSSPKGMNEFVTWFDVTVFFKSPNYFNVQSKTSSISKPAA